MSLPEVLARAGESGLPLERLVVGTEPDVVPSGPSGTWVLFPTSDGVTALGGMDRGGFRPYGRYEDDAATLNALRHVLLEPVLNLPRRGWLLRAPLPPTCRVGPVRPWFGQPGGGIRVALATRPAGTTTPGCSTPSPSDRARRPPGPG